MGINKAVCVVGRDFIHVKLHLAGVIGEVAEMEGCLRGCIKN